MLTGPRHWCQSSIRSRAALAPQCLDEVAINVEMRAQLREFYPEAKVAYLKTGGNFPYLSRSDEIVMHIKVRVLEGGLGMEDTHRHRSR